MVAVGVGVEEGVRPAAEPVRVEALGGRAVAAWAAVEGSAPDVADSDGAPFVALPAGSVLATGAAASAGASATARKSLAETLRVSTRSPPLPQPPAASTKAAIPAATADRQSVSCVRLRQGEGRSFTSQSNL